MEIEQLKEFQNKYIDIELLFCVLVKLRYYDYGLYIVLRKKLIIQLMQNNFLIRIMDLELTKESLSKFYYWYNYFNCFENIEIKFNF